MNHVPNSLVDILRYRVKEQPNQLAFRYLVDGEYDEALMTYEELDLRARSIAVLLRSCVKEGERALLIFPPGLDFIAAFFGCLYAKILAVPVYYPHPARLDKNLSDILRIAHDAMPAAALLTTSLRNAITYRKEIAEEFKNIKLLATDHNELSNLASAWEQPFAEKNDIAFLQYTSGSTSTPRAVIVTHGNLLHNLGLIEKCFGQSSKSHAVIWLPHYHDMGLAGILQPVYTGYPATLLSHMMFLQRPIRWLQAISRFRATTSGGPNFAYDLCTRKIKPEQRELLDLSSWEVAFNGAEPIYHKTLDEFTEYFAPSGFRPGSFLPCYGLAEATLMVTGAPKGRIPVIKNLVSSALEQDQVIVSSLKNKNTRTLVSSGRKIQGQQIIIVDTEKTTLCSPDQIGEIWVSGPSVAKGYWNNPSETELAFGARLSNQDEGPFLRTGDLGFLHEGELYITGRLKNLVICDGKNHYAQDIERTVERSHPAIRLAGCAVFSVIDSLSERIIVIAEVEHRLAVDSEEVTKAIRQAVALNHDLHVHDIRLTNPGDIPRTTSGKIRHFLCKTNYMAETNKEIKSI